MKILGLTGSVGMGKSTVATLLRRRKFPVFDADKIVHQLLAAGGAAVKPIGQIFPTSLVDDHRHRRSIDRKKLGEIVFADRPALRQLEAILHPLVDRARQKFLAQHRRNRRAWVVLDLPLLFETHKEYLCDVIITVHAPDFIQAQRVLARPGMTKARLAAIRNQQWPSRVKCRMADFTLQTGLGKAFTARLLTRFMLSQPGQQPRQKNHRSSTALFNPNARSSLGGKP